MQPQTLTATPRRIKSISLARFSENGRGQGVRACRHARQMLITTGTIYFAAGEVIDTIHTVSVCLSCGEEFPAA